MQQRVKTRRRNIGDSFQTQGTTDSIESVIDCACCKTVVRAATWFFLFCLWLGQNRQNILGSTRPHNVLYHTQLPLYIVRLDSWLTWSSAVFLFCWLQSASDMIINNLDLSIALETRSAFVRLEISYETLHHLVFRAS